MEILHANVELLIIDFLFVGLLFFFNLRHWKPRLINPLSMIYILVMAGCIFEISAFIVDGNLEYKWLNYLSNILYLGSIGLIGACMMEHCNKIFPKPIWKNKILHFIILLPVIIELLLLATAPWTGLVFTVDSNGFYVRGETFFIQMIPYGYLIVTTVLGIMHFVRSETTKERKEYLAIALFSLPPFLLGSIQLAIKANTLDIMMASIAMSLLANFAVSQNNEITRDSLTKLPNRVVLDTVLEEKMRNERRDERDTLYVLMGDLDGFKKINDTYGHLEGDRALIIAADALYEISKKYRGTAARFAGDEFVVVLEAETEDLVKQFIKEVDRRLINDSKDEKFLLAMSIGYASYRRKDTIQDILKAADRELYSVKQKKNVKR